MTKASERILQEFLSWLKAREGGVLNGAQSDHRSGQYFAYHEVVYQFEVTLGIVQAEEKKEEQPCDCQIYETCPKCKDKI